MYKFSHLIKALFFSTNFFNIIFFQNFKFFLIFFYYFLNNPKNKRVKIKIKMEDEKSNIMSNNQTNLNRQSIIFTSKPY